MNLYLQTMLWMVMASIGELISPIRNHPTLSAWLAFYVGCVICMARQRRNKHYFAYTGTCLIVAVMSFFNYLPAAVVLVGQMSTRDARYFDLPIPVSRSVVLLFGGVSVITCLCALWSMPSEEVPAQEEANGDSKK